LRRFREKKLALFIIVITLGLPLSGSSAASPYSLVISYKQSPQSEIQKLSLKCNPVSGTMPKAKTACSRLLKIANPFATANPDQMCTQIYGGDEVATVKGSWKGKKVSATYSKRDGCEIARWAALKFLLEGSFPS
jgi:hypothetical protein